jgi:DNA-binding transcriptional MerR regulator
MRVAELSRTTGVPVPTIKYYLREGLLPPGVRTSPNQASYSGEHVKRIKLIRALVDIGGLSINGARDVLAAVDHPDEAVFDVLSTVSAGLGISTVDGSGEAWSPARDRVEQLIESLGWQAKLDEPAVEVLIAAATALHDLGRDDLIDLFEPYAEWCLQLAKIEVAVVNRRDDIGDLVEGMVIGTVLGDVVLSVLRRMAHQDLAAQLFAGRCEAADRRTG